MSNDNQGNNMNNDRNPNVEFNPDELTDAQKENLKTKLALVMNMAGSSRNPDTLLTVLTAALVEATLQCDVEISSVVKVLILMYESHPANNQKGESDE